MSKLNWDKVTVEQRVLSHGAEAYSPESNEAGYSAPSNIYRPEMNLCPQCGCHVTSALLQQHFILDCPKLRKKNKVKVTCEVCKQEINKSHYKNHLRKAHWQSTSNSSSQKQQKPMVVRPSAAKAKHPEKEKGTSQPFNGIRFDGWDNNS